MRPCSATPNDCSPSIVFIVRHNVVYPPSSQETDAEESPHLSGGPLMPPLRVAKEGFRRLLPPDHPARLALEAQPDHIPESEFLALYPVLIRLSATKGVG
jgi:hypothetical protein